MFRTTRSYLEALITALSNENKITFKEGKKWVTNVAKREVTYNPTDLVFAPALVAKGIIIHEVGHILFTDKIQKDTPNLIKHPSMQYVYNQFEDMRIEYLLMQQYRGFAIQALAHCSTWGLIGRISLAKLKMLERTKLMEFLDSTNLQRFYSGKIVEWSRNNLYYLARDLRDYNSTEVKKALSSADSDIQACVGKILNASSTEVLKQLVDQYIYRHAKPFLDEADKQLEKEQREGKADGNKSIEEELREGKPDRSFEGKMEEYLTDIPSDEELRSLLGGYIHTLTQRLADILKEKASVRYTGAHKKGRLLSKNAYKVTVSDETRLFSKRTNPDTPHYSITFVLDESGSMEGYFHAQTYIASFLINEAMKRLKFEIKYIRFNHTTQVISDLSVYRKMRGGGNNEFLALDVTYKNINKYDDNIVLMMTDGGIGVNSSTMRTLIHKIEKEKNATLIAIGVGLTSDYLKQFYPTYIAVPKIEQLPLKMIEMMRSLIHR